MRKFLGTLIIVIVVMSFVSCVFILNNFVGDIKDHQVDVKKPSILLLKLEGVILDGSELLENLRDYAKEEEVKGVLIQVNSPGGVVGASQELYSEIRRTRDELKKPVVVSVLNLAASGAYYAAVGADKIVTNPGSLMGSIGVIMEFANLEKLYQWAKIDRYSIKTGAYKDSGSEYRPMRADEKVLFQNLADEVLGQFKSVVAKERKLSPEAVSQMADGRVFTGQKAVAMGFADQVGTYEDARKLIGQLSGIGENPDVFEPPVKPEDVFMELFGKFGSSIHNRIETALKLELLGKPLFLMPGVISSSRN